MAGERGCQDIKKLVSFFCAKKSRPAMIKVSLLVLIGFVVLLSLEYLRQTLIFSKHFIARSFMPQVVLHYGNQTFETKVFSGATVLNAIQAAGLAFPAPCGGKGTCGKCEVLLRNNQGAQLVLACKTPAVSGMQLEIDPASAHISLEPLNKLNRESSFGVAIDLGTTTLAAELVDLQSKESVVRIACMNPQLIFGADVISRIEAADSGKLPEMTSLITDTLYDLMRRLCKEVLLELSDLDRIILAGNTIMEHLAAGLSPVSIGVAPFLPLAYFGEYLELWSDLPPVWFAPCVSGYVGGDMVSGMLCEQDFPSLLIDLGTNGELALQTKEGSVSAATAAGPVFEGMNIRFGMPALPGAISQIAYDPAHDKLQARVIGGAKARGFCGSGLVDLAALMLSEGLIDESGRLLTQEESSSPLASRLREFEGAPAFKPLDDFELVVTQKDIRNLQLAKAALAAGIEIVLDTAELTFADLNSVAVAGGFGQHMNMEKAGILGLVPKPLLHKACSVGNSSLCGARKMLLDANTRDHATRLAQKSEYVELSTDHRFSGRFIEHMGFGEL